MSFNHPLPPQHCDHECAPPLLPFLLFLLLFLLLVFFLTWVLGIEIRSSCLPDSALYRLSDLSNLQLNYSCLNLAMWLRLALNSSCTPSWPQNHTRPAVALSIGMASPYHQTWFMRPFLKGVNKATSVIVIFTMQLTRRPCSFQSRTPSFWHIYNQ